MPRKPLPRFVVPLALGAATVVAAVATFGGIHQPQAPVSLAESKQLIADAEPVLAAVRRYEKRVGHAPRTLSDLVPQDLPRVPQPRIASGHDYFYGVEPNQWRFAIPLPGAKDDVLMYSSIGDYEEDKPTDPVERIGKWARYHGNPF